MFVGTLEREAPPLCLHRRWEYVTLSSGYYSQESQIEAVEKILMKDMDFDTFMKKIHEMIRTQKAGDVQLNPNTIKALQSIL